MILADSGFWVALLSLRDKHHGEAIQAAQTHAGETLVTTWPVLSEASHLIGRNATIEQQLLFLRHIRISCRLHDFPLEALARMEALMRKYCDLPMDLADASMVMLAEELDEGRILSTDKNDFKTYRWKNNKPFRNLLLVG